MLSNQLAISGKCRFLLANIVVRKNTGFPAIDTSASGPKLINFGGVAQLVRAPAS